MTPTKPKSVAELVRSKREAQGLSRDKLATQVGVHVSTIIRLESQNDIPKTQTMFDLADVLDIDLSTLRELVKSAARVGADWSERTAPAPADA